MNSKDKGKRGEREFANFCRQHSFEARRGQQYNGIEGEDVVGLEGIHVEVKREENLNVHKAMRQSVEESRGKVPILAHRKNGKEWLITMRAEDWLKVYGVWQKATQGQNGSS